MATIIRNKAGDVIRRSRNLRGVLDYARDVSPVEKVELPERSKGPYPIAFTFYDGSRADTTFEDWRVAARWVAARRSWGRPVLFGMRRFIDMYRETRL